MTPTPTWQLFVPKLITVLREGYGLNHFRRDAIAGLTVAIIALPLAMAIAIASGTTPDKGLITAVIAGFMISALGGSRFSIGGPTAAFAVVVFNVIERFGYSGLLVATLMAGLLLIIAGLAQLGTWIKYIPEPVVTGFTSGIAVVIASSQLRDFFGLPLDKMPGDFVAQWQLYLQHGGEVNAQVLSISAGALAVIVLLRRYAPQQPAFLYAVAGGALVVWGLQLPVATIGSRFGHLAVTLPAPSLPSISWTQLKLLLPSAFTIAFLAGVESLLCAMVADGMAGRRHRSNVELVAQGLANLCSPLFGGLPATGAIARTAVNIRAGACSPVAGMLHAVLLLLFMLALGPLIAFIPMATLAAVLMMVAWNMSEHERFRHLLRAPAGDRIVLLLTFTLTVLIDLTVAIEVGVVLAALLFMHRMAQASGIHALPLIDTDRDDASDKTEGAQVGLRAGIPKDVQLIEMRGPFFFGVASRLSEVLDRVGKPPRAFILQMNRVPLIDATGISAIKELLKRCERDHTRVLLCELQPSVSDTLAEMGLRSDPRLQLCATLDDALRASAAHIKHY